MWSMSWPSTTSRQRTRAWAFCSSSFQLYPISFSSASVSRRKLFLERPLFFFSWGFHLGACRVEYCLVLFAGCDQSSPISFSKSVHLPVVVPLVAKAPHCEFSHDQATNYLWKSGSWIFLSAFLVRVVLSVVWGGVPPSCPFNRFLLVSGRK